MIRIPLIAKPEPAQPLRRAIERTARETGLPAEQVAVTMSWFLEHVVDEVSKERTVSIPSFGAFGAWLVEDRAALVRVSPHPASRIGELVPANWAKTVNRERRTVESIAVEAQPRLVTSRGSSRAVAAGRAGPVRRQSAH